MLNNAQVIDKSTFSNFLVVRMLGSPGELETCMKPTRARPPAEKYLVYLRRDPVTQVVVEEGWYATASKDPALHPPFHRLDGPAAIARDPSTGVVIQESWYREGQLHREDGPAMTYRTVEGKT